MTTGLRRRHRAALTLAATVVFALIVPGVAFSHAVVYPKSSAPGAYERYVLRVPNEKAIATTRIEIHFPADARVTSFADVAGWQLEVRTDSAERIVGAVWTGSLAPQRFVELPFVAVNPKSATRLVWPVTQTYADSITVDWTGAEGSKTPASVTAIAPAGPTGESGATRWVPWGALIVALVALGLALRRSGTAPDGRASA
jgi:Uncharacterized protein conserved in bacteria